MILFEFITTQEASFSEVHRDIGQFLTPQSPINCVHCTGNAMTESLVYHPESQLNTATRAYLLLTASTIIHHAITSRLPLLVLLLRRLRSTLISYRTSTSRVLQVCKVWHETSPDKRFHCCGIQCHPLPFCEAFDAFLRIGRHAISLHDSSLSISSVPDRLH